MNKYITSHGLITYCIVDNICYYLLYQQRDTYEYIDFIQGNWTKIDELPYFFKKMSVNEREMIRNYTIEELCDDLWVRRDTRYCNDMFPKVKKKYESIRDKIQHFLETTQSYRKSPDWGFPKGKKQSKETNKKCAIREFKEETNINDIYLDVSSNTFVEKFLGSNDKLYSTIYYLAKTDKLYKPKYISTPNSIRKSSVSAEAMDIKWVTLKESKNYLNEQRYEILCQVQNMIENGIK